MIPFWCRHNSTTCEGEGIIIPVGKTQHGSVCSGTPENIAKLLCSVGLSSQKWYSLYVARTGHSSSQFPRPEEQALEVLPSERCCWCLWKLYTVSICIEVGAHFTSTEVTRCISSWDEAWAKALPWRFHPIVGLILSGAWMRWSAFCVRNVRHQTRLHGS